MVFGKVESMNKSKTSYDWDPEACSRLAPVSEPARSCGLPRDCLPAAPMRAAGAGRGRVGPTPVRCITPDDDGTRCSFFFLVCPCSRRTLAGTADDKRRRSPGPSDLQETGDKGYKAMLLQEVAAERARP